MSSLNYGYGAVDLSTLAQPAAAGTQKYSVTTADFTTAVLEKSENTLVIVDLGSPQSSMSMQLSAVLAQLADACSGTWALAQVNCDTSPEIPAAFRIRTIPTVVAVYAARPVAVLEQAYDKEKMLAWINEVLAKIGGQPIPQAQEHPGFLAAQYALMKGETQEALDHIAKILADEPHNEEAQHLKRNIEFIDRAQHLSPQCLSEAEKDKSSPQLQCDAADYLIVQGDVTRAFDLLIAAFITYKPEPSKAQTIKEHLFELFTLFSSDSPEVKTARMALSNAIF